MQGDERSQEDDHKDWYPRKYVDLRAESLEKQRSKITVRLRKTMARICGMISKMVAVQAEET